MGLKMDFSRQLQVQGMTDLSQEKLTHSKVLILGAGGLGMTAATYLATAGVGQITIVDPDVIDASNLHRQFMYRPEDVGQKKVNVAYQFLQQRAPYTSIETHSYKLLGQQLYDICALHDLILDCTDDLFFSFELNDWGVLLQKPVIFANATGLDGQLFTAHNHQHQSPCLRCLWPNGPVSTSDCTRNGVLGPVPGILGSHQALEAIKLLTQCTPSLENTMIHFDFSTLQQERWSVTKERGCNHDLSHYRILQRHQPTPFMVPAINLQDYTVFDIREHTHQNTILPSAVKSVRIPLQKLLQDPTSHINRRAKTLLVCDHGKRSFYAAKQLQQQGFTSVYGLLF